MTGLLFALAVTATSLKVLPPSQRHTSVHASCSKSGLAPRRPPLLQDLAHGRRMTTVSSANELSNQIGNSSISYIFLEPGTYSLNSPLSISRDVILEAGPGTVVLDGEGSTRVLEN